MPSALWKLLIPMATCFWLQAVFRVVMDDELKEGGGGAPVGKMLWKVGALAKGAALSLMY